MSRNLFAAAAAAAVFTSPVFASNDNTYLWVHPKLGPQRIDRATNAPPRKAATSAPDAKSAGKAEPTRFWIDPKGNVRRTPLDPPTR